MTKGRYENEYLAGKVTGTLFNKAGAWISLTRESIVVHHSPTIPSSNQPVAAPPCERTLSPEQLKKYICARSLAFAQRFRETT
jgi:hypothetical protein